MKKLLYNILISLFILFYFTTVLFASETVGTSGADFLEIGVGSRPLGMGEAFVAETDDINCIYYNPAGLGSIKYPILSVHHQELIMDTRFENLSISYPLKYGNIALANSFFWVKPFDKIDINGNNVGTVDFYNGAITVGYGYDFGFMYVGASMKYVYQKVDSLVLHAVAFDIGILKGLYLYSPFDAPSRNFHIGLSVTNLGTNVRGHPLPRTIRLGISYKLTKWIGFNIDISESIIEASDLLDFTYGFDESFRLYMGVEASVLNLLYLRAGYKFNDGGTYSFGLGFNYVVKNVTFNIDSSYTDSGIFGPTYSFNVSFKLIPKVITIKDKEDANTHYKNGIKYFIANDIDSAIDEFKKTKDYNPYHKNINRKIKDLNEIKELQKQNEDLDEELKNLE